MLLSRQMQISSWSKLLCVTVTMLMFRHVLLRCAAYTVYGQEAVTAAAEASRACTGPADYQLINV